MQDSLGGQYQLEYLVLLLALLAINRRAPGSFSSPPFLDVLAQESLTDILSDTWASAKTSEDQHLESYWRAFSKVVDLTGIVPSISDLQVGIRGWRDPAFTDSDYLVMNILCLIHHAISVSPASCLDDFSTRFRLLSSMRKLDRENEMGRLAKALANLGGGLSVSKVELRKNVDIVDIDNGIDLGFVAQEFRNDLRVHVGAAALVRAARPNSSFSVSVPVSFQKGAFGSRARDESAPGFLIHSLPNYVSTAEALASSFLEEPWLLELVRGFDAVGLESSTPNWVISQTYSWMLDRIGSTPALPVFSVHAGEQFSNSLNGLRRIGELLDFDVHVARIGHGLVLGDDDFWGTQAGAASEALFDLVWLGQVLDDADVIDFCVDLASRVILSSSLVGWTELEMLRRSLFSLSKFREIGLLPRVRPFEFDTVASTVEPRSLKVESEVDQLLCSHVFRNGYAGIRWSTRLSSSDAKECLSIGRRFAGAAKEVLLQLLSGRLIECCPTSNVLLGAQSFDGHAIWSFMRRGISVSVSTDDPGLFSTSLSEEMGRLSRWRPPDFEHDNEWLVRLAEESLKSTLSADGVRFGELIDLLRL